MMHLNQEVSSLKWLKILEESSSFAAKAEKLRTMDDTRVFPRSVQYQDGCLYFMVKEADGTVRLVVAAESAVPSGFRGAEIEEAAFPALLCQLSPENAKALRGVFSWTAPSACGTQGVSMGLGDRLGLAASGHIKTVRDRNVKPVLAQQSIRELDLTGRTYIDVLDAATWGVFQEGYKDGFGADGDHLKRAKDVTAAVNLGFSMITLDCSEHIDDNVSAMSTAEINAAYEAWPPDERELWESLYLGTEFPLEEEQTVEFAVDQFRAMVLVYGRALAFAERIYHEILAKAPQAVDFEVSIDEVATPTTPQDHYFVAAELARRGVKVNSLAPRFCGEFQKAIDYIGDKQQFEDEFAIHAAIARKFGYKLSIHSGSDKFSVYPIIGRHTQGNCHVKTAGTNWLEALRVVADKDPQLYRDIHAFALEKLDEARAFYHVGLDTAKIPDIQKLDDVDLPDLMDQDDARQALHITYGFILQEKDAAGRFVFADRFFQCLRTHEAAYEDRLQLHIGKHLDLLGVLKDAQL